MIALYILKRFIIKNLDKIVVELIFCQMCRKQKQTVAITKDSFVQSDNIFKELDLSQLSELYLRSQVELNSYKELLAKPNSELKNKFD